MTGALGEHSNLEGRADIASETLLKSTQWRREHLNEIVGRILAHGGSGVDPAPPRGPMGRHSLKSTRSTITLDTAMRTRRSRPVVGDQLGHLDQLGAVLGPALSSTATVYDGATGHQVRLRAYPSAGALYPCKTYVLLLNCVDAGSAVTVHDPEANELIVLRREPKERLVEPFFGMTPLIPAIAILVVAADVSRVTPKYGCRAWRFAILEAGHMCQNICLSAEAAQLSALPWGGFFDDELAALLGLKATEAPVAAIVISSKSVGGDD